MNNSTPPPGSDTALDQGCTCPVIDNGHGRGWMGQPGVYVITEGCPLHASQPLPPAPERDEPAMVASEG